MYRNIPGFSCHLYVFHDPAVVYEISLFVTGCVVNLKFGKFVNRPI